MGLVLIAIAVASVAMIVQRADTTQPFYAAARDLAPGRVLQEDDLVIVNVRVSQGEYVPQADAVAGRVLDRTVGKGELVPAAALVDQAGYASRAIAVESAMPLADGVGIGSVVDVWLTVQGEGGPHSTLVGSELAITDVRESESSLGSSAAQTVYVAVPLADVGRVLAAVAADGDVAIVATGS